RHTSFDCDWSSDVCSSDLGVPERLREGFAVELRISSRAWKGAYIDQTFDSRPLEQRQKILERSCRMPDRVDRHGMGGPPGDAPRSEERRVGKEDRSAEQTR